MHSALNVRLEYEDLRTLAFGSISGTYAAVGAAFVNPVRMLKITNTTNADLLISFDGTTDKDVVPAYVSQIYDFGTNKGKPDGTLEQRVGDRVYVKQAAGAASLGSVYVTVMFAGA